MPTQARRTTAHTSTKRWRTLLTLAAGLCWLYASTAFANHPVLVEGETDFDGDGLLGVAEDTDNDTDQIFGTVNAALAAANRGANQNGHVIIVTSGRFLETVTITAVNGDVTLQAAPGVEAEFEAVRAGDPASATRQASPGIIVDAPDNRRVTLRNLVSRNWTDGIQILGASHVVIDGCRVEHNRDNGIRAIDSARVTIINSQVNANGFRNGGGVDNAPNPGHGVIFRDTSKGAIYATTVSGNLATGIANQTGNPLAVRLFTGTISFDNGRNFSAVIAPPR